MPFRRYLFLLTCDRDRLTLTGIQCVTSHGHVVLCQVNIKAIIAISEFIDFTAT